MAYIGNTAASRFVSNRAASVFSGDGSAVAFTLEQVVTQDEDILVSVDGVVQEPSVAYAVSSGTTLTFTAAPSTNSGNNIFVYYLASQAGTVGHPSTQGLTATTGTFTGNVSTTPGSVSIKTINGGYTGGLLIEDDSNTTKSAITHVVGTLAISANASADHMLINADGAITKPLQPAFSVKPASNQDNIANTNVVAFGTEIFDQNADFASNVFTAPVTGRYQIDVNLGLLQVDSAAAFIGLDVDTSNRHYYVLIDPDFGQDAAYWELHFSGLIDMDGSDTITIKFLQSGGTTQADVEDAHTNFSGYLVA